VSSSSFYSLFYRFSTTKNLVKCFCIESYSTVFLYFIVNLFPVRIVDPDPHPDPDCGSGSAPGSGLDPD
jgi:hypothetical protein